MSNPVWRRFRRNRMAWIALPLLVLLILVALLAPLLANNRPLYARIYGQAFYPVFTPHKSVAIRTPETGDSLHLNFGLADWRNLPYEKVVWPPIAYSPGFADALNRNYAAPKGEQWYVNALGERVPLPPHLRHHLGTDAIGRDVAAGIIHGTRISLSIGLVAVGIAALVGILLGALAGYFGDFQWQVGRWRFWVFWLGLLPGFFYGFTVREERILEAFAQGWLYAVASTGLGLAIMVFMALGFSWLVGFIIRRQKPRPVPVDILVSRSIEVLDSLPKLLLIIALAAVVSGQSIYLVMVIIGLTSWTGIARLTRAEFLRIRGLAYVESARALGYGRGRIILKHGLPNVMAPVFVAMAFGIASAILVESSLSFLGIGVPPELVTWGQMLSAGRQHIGAWWLIVFPGIAIFITVTAFNLIGDALRDALDPHLKR